MIHGRGGGWASAPGDELARGYAGYIRVGLLRLFRNGRASRIASGA